MEVTVLSAVSGDSAVVGVPEAGDVSALRRSAADALGLCESMCVLHLCSGEDTRLTDESFHGLSDGDTVTVTLADEAEARLELTRRGFDTDNLKAAQVIRAVQVGDEALFHLLFAAGAPRDSYVLQSILREGRLDFLSMALEAETGTLPESVICTALHSSNDECYHMVLGTLKHGDLNLAGLTNQFVWRRGYPFQRLQSLYEKYGMTEGIRSMLENHFTDFAWDAGAVSYLLRNIRTVPRAKLLEAARESVRRKSPGALEILVAEFTAQETVEFTSVHPSPLEMAVARGCTRSTRLLLRLGCARDLCFDKKRGRHARYDKARFEVPRVNLDCRRTPGRVLFNLFLTPPAMSACAPILLECAELQPYVALPIVNEATSRTLLHHVAGKGDRDATRLLLEYGANVDAVDEKGRTPLMHAAHHGHAKVVAELLAAREGAACASVGKACDDGAFPLFEAAGRGHVDVVARLLEGGADPNAATPAGTTALHCAAYRGHAGAVRCLLTGGAHPDAQNNRGTPLGAAEARGHVEVLALLRNASPSGGSSQQAGEGVDAGVTCDA